MRVLTAIINRDAEGAPLHDLRARQALNLAVDRTRLIEEVFAGNAHPLAGLTPHYAAGVPSGQRPYEHDPDQARDLLASAGWRSGRELRLAAPAALEAAARRLSEDFTGSLGVEVDLTLVPDDQLRRLRNHLRAGRDGGRPGALVPPLTAAAARRGGRARVSRASVARTAAGPSRRW